MSSDSDPVDLNQLAGQMLRRAREAADAKALLFAPAIGRRLGKKMPQSTLSNYEIGRRPVPAAVLLAAAEISGKSLDELARSGSLLETIRAEVAAQIKALREETTDT